MNRALRQAGEQGVQPHGGEVLVDVGVFHALQRGFDHHIKVVQVFVEFGAQGVVVQQFGAQLEPHDGCFEPVRNAEE